MIAMRTHLVKRTFKDFFSKNVFETELKKSCTIHLDCKSLQRRLSVPECFINRVTSYNLSQGWDSPRLPTITVVSKFFIGNVPIRQR